MMFHRCGQSLQRFSGWFRTPSRSRLVKTDEADHFQQIQMDALPPNGCIVIVFVLLEFVIIREFHSDLFFSIFLGKYKT